MSRSLYRDRRAAVIENRDLRMTVLEEGGHIAELFDKRAGINPLWTPPWPSIEPSSEFRASASRSKVYESDFGVAVRSSPDVAPLRIYFGNSSGLSNAFA